MEPLERSVSHGTDTESVDTLATNQSPGPALVGNISVDSLANDIYQFEPSPSIRVVQEQQAGEGEIKQEGEKEKEASSKLEEPDQLIELKTEGQGEKQEEKENRERQVQVDEQKVDITEENLQQEPLEKKQQKHQQQDEEKRVRVEEQKVDVIGDSIIKQEPLEQQQHQHQDEEQQNQQDEDQRQQQQQQQEQSDTTNTSQGSQEFGDELDNEKNSIMEFAKNYSDDLISNELHRATSGQTDSNSAPVGAGPSLADFDLPAYSSSSSGGGGANDGGAKDQVDTANKHSSPTKQRKSSGTMTTSKATSSASSQVVGSSVSPITHNLSAVINTLKSTYKRASPIFQWKKPIESGLIFAFGLITIIALTFFSIISVIAYGALGIMSASGLLRIYKTGMKALNRSSETPIDHIWSKALSLNVSLSSERLHELADVSHASLNSLMVYLKQVLLVENKMAALKFFIFSYTLTYIGSWFNGLTLFTLIYVSLFLVPLFYEKNKKNIDQYVNLTTKQITSSISMVTDKVSSVMGSQVGGGGSKKQD